MIATPLLIIHTTTMKEIVTYCGEEVELLEIIQGPKKQFCLDSFRRWPRR